MKKTIKSLLPDFIINKIQNFKSKSLIKQAYIYDFNRYKEYSGSLGNYTKDILLGNIIKKYHVIEKGLTMPEPRLGFGKDMLLSLINSCRQYADLYDIRDIQFINAIGVIFEYEKFHKERDYRLDKNILDEISILQNKYNNLQSTNQLKFTKDEFVKCMKSSFKEFSNSRHSVRNFSNDNIELDILIEAVELSKNAPSACNRQPCQVYIYTDKDKIKKILDAQGGNKGFGHLANKLLILTANLSVFSNVSERYEAYIDGGIYAMNLLYSLHYHEIGCCILNCNHDISKDLMMRDLCNIRENEIFIAMFACGKLPESFSVAMSKRYSINYKVMDDL